MIRHLEMLVQPFRNMFLHYFAAGMIRKRMVPALKKLRRNAVLANAGYR